MRVYRDAEQYHAPDEPDARHAANTRTIIDSSTTELTVVDRKSALFFQWTNPRLESPSFLAPAVLPDYVRLCRTQAEDGMSETISARRLSLFDGLLTGEELQADTGWGQRTILRREAPGTSRYQDWSDEALPRRQGQGLAFVTHSEPTRLPRPRAAEEHRLIQPAATTARWTRQACMRLGDTGVSTLGTAIVKAASSDI